MPAGNGLAAAAGKDDGGLLDAVPAGPRWRAMREVKRRTFRYMLYGARPAPLPSRHGLLEAPEAHKLGICCSGGGIRSAAFNLGALQVLQDEEEAGESLLPGGRLGRLVHRRGVLDGGQHVETRA